MDARLGPLHAILKLNTQLFLNTLEGVSDAHATTRPNEKMNHMGFIACHLIDARHYLAGYTGRTVAKPFGGILEAAEKLEDMTSLPTVEEQKAAWEAISRLLTEHFMSLGEADLGRESSHPFPVDDRTVLGGITFLIEHESYHIGQLSLLRRFLDLPPMKYTRTAGR